MPQHVVDAFGCLGGLPQFTGDRVGRGHVGDRDRVVVVDADEIHTVPKPFRKQPFQPRSEAGHREVGEVRRHLRARLYSVNVSVEAAVGVDDPVDHPARVLGAGAAVHEFAPNVLGRFVERDPQRIGPLVPVDDPLTEGHQIVGHAGPIPATTIDFPARMHPVVEGDHRPHPGVDDRPDHPVVERPPGIVVPSGRRLHPRPLDAGAVNLDTQRLRPRDVLGIPVIEVDTVAHLLLDLALIAVPHPVRVPAVPLGLEPGLRHPELKIGPERRHRRIRHGRPAHQPDQRHRQHHPHQPHTHPPVVSCPAPGPDRFGKTAAKAARVAHGQPHRGCPGLWRSW